MFPWAKDLKDQCSAYKRCINYWECQCTVPGGFILRATSTAITKLELWQEHTQKRSIILQLVNCTAWKICLEHLDLRMITHFKFTSPANWDKLWKWFANFLILKNYHTNCPANWQINQQTNQPPSDYYKSTSNWFCQVYSKTSLKHHRQKLRLPDY